VILLTLFMMALPLVAILWAIAGLFLHRRNLRKQEFLSLLGALLMLPLGILYIGLMEMGAKWLVSLPGLGFGSVFLAGLAIFVRAEILKQRDRARPRWACQECGYDRRGIEGPCPECGSNHTEASS